MKISFIETVKKAQDFRIVQKAWRLQRHINGKIFVDAKFCFPKVSDDFCFRFHCDIMTTEIGVKVHVIGYNVAEN